MARTSPPGCQAEPSHSAVNWSRKPVMAQPGTATARPCLHQVLQRVETVGPGHRTRGLGLGAWGPGLRVQRQGSAYLPWGLGSRAQGSGPRFSLLALRRSSFSWKWSIVVAWPVLLPPPPPPAMYSALPIPGPRGGTRGSCSTRWNLGWGVGGGGHANYEIYTKP